MNCPNCGSSVNQEGAFCVVCGTKLINPNVQNGNYINCRDLVSALPVSVQGSPYSVVAGTISLSKAV